jgi:hypothetical protein
MERAIFLTIKGKVLSSIMKKKYKFPGFLKMEYELNRVKEQNTVCKAWWME